METQITFTANLTPDHINKIAEAATQKILGRAMFSSTNNTPKIGHMWPNEGGVYAGIARDGDRQWHLIMPTNQQAIIAAEWGKDSSTIEGEFSRVDGQHNMQLILAAEPNNKIAKYFNELEIDGHKDLYWPAQFEQNLICMNLREFIEKKWHWSSTQYSAHNAWNQGFGDGYSDIYYKGISLAARAVRRLPIE